MSLQSLRTVPENVRQAAAVIAGLDRCFLVGFGRPGPEQHAALQALERVCSGTPLDGPVKNAVAAIGRSEFVDRHFAALAAARAALQGAQYDALRARVHAALGRTVPATESAAPPAAPAEGPVAVWQESARNWLMELALAGFQQLEAPTIAPFLSTLEHLQGEARTARLAAVLTGFLNELLDALPVSALPAVPLAAAAEARPAAVERSPEEGAVFALLADHPASVEALARLLGVEPTWNKAAPAPVAGAAPAAVGDRSPEEAGARSLLTEHSQSAAALAALLGP